MRTALPRLLLEHRRTLAALLAGLAVLTGLSSVHESHDGPVVVAAARDVPSGRSLTAADLTTVRLTDATVPRSALTSTSQAVGRRLAGAVRRGELLTDRRVLGPGPLAGRRAGTVLTTIRLGDADGLGAVRVGDAVDVVAVDPERQGTAHVVVRGLEVLASREAAGTDGALVDLATTEKGALDLAEAGLRSRLTVLVSTPGQAAR